MKMVVNPKINPQFWMNANECHWFLAKWSNGFWLDHDTISGPGLDLRRYFWPYELGGTERNGQFFASGC